jgi:putative FmdB family regulatory protein
MPIYVYRCPECDRTQEVMRSVSRRDDEIVCGDDGRPMHRVPTSPGAVHVGLTRGAILKNPMTGETKSVDGLINKSAPRKR